MGFLYFVAIVGAIGVCVVGTAWLARGRLRGPIIPIIRVASGNGRQQAILVTAALKSADIWFEARDESVVPYGRGGDLFLRYEVWVKEEDVEGARAVLGLDEELLDDTPLEDDTYTHNDVTG